jgi:phage anti-repressor protein
VWSWMGFSRKDVAKRLVEKTFYVGQRLFWNSASEWSALTHHKMEGKTRKPYFLSLDIRWNLCMRANTSKADTVRGYFRKMNRVMMDHLKIANPWSSESR